MATKWKDIKFKFSVEERLKIREEALAEVRAMEERDRVPEDVAWLRRAIQEADEHSGPGVPMEDMMDG